MHLVDLPDVTAEVVRRVIGQAPPGTASLSRATYDGRPGHPVCIGRDHLESLMVELTGDSGARDYLAEHGVMVWNVVIWPAARTTTTRGSVDM